MKSARFSAKIGLETYATTTRPTQQIIKTRDGKLRWTVSNTEFDKDHIINAHFSGGQVTIQAGKTAYL